MRRKLALFDLDNTLLAGDSDFEWAQFLIEQGVLDREIYEARNLEFYEQYKAGTLDIHEFLDFQLKPLARHRRAVLDAWHREFMEHKIRPIIRDSARALVERHAGDLRVLITATNSFVTAPIAREFGIEHLIATEPAHVDGEFTGGVTLSSFDETWFYSDSLNDMPLLERVTHPVAVDPDDTLRAYAKARAWPVISLSTPVAQR